MGYVSISDALALLGDAALEDSKPQLRERFLEFIRQSKWQPDDFRYWIEGCLAKGSRQRPAYYYALQDIVVTIGMHLGMKVEYGSYSSYQPGVPWDGRWWTSDNSCIIVEVKASAWPSASYLDVCAALEDAAEDRLYGLFVVGQGSTRELIEQIKGGEYRNQLKVISCNDLVRLWRLKMNLERTASDQRAARMVQSVLLPFESVNVGSLVNIIYEVAARQDCEKQEQVATPPAKPTAQPWQPAELWAFLDDSQPTQVALLMALSCSTEPSVPMAVVVQRMKQAARWLPHIPQDVEFNAKSVGGARAGFSKRAHALGKESFLDVAGSHYRIKDRYKECIAEWLRERGLDVDCTAVAKRDAEEGLLPPFEPLVNKRLPFFEGLGNTA